MAAHKETTDEAHAADSGSAEQAGEHTEEQAEATTPPEADALAEMPAVWLKWRGPKHYAHVPAQGSGADGELTPDEVRAYFTPALYREATTGDAPMYVVVDAAELRDVRPKKLRDDEAARAAAARGGSK